MDIIQLSSPDELDSFVHSTNSEIILFVETHSYFQHNLINRIRNNNVVHVIGLAGTKEEKSDYSNDPKINLSTSGSKIQQIVSEILYTSNNQSLEAVISSELTVREKDVLKLVALGHSNKEIADQLFISIHTVISHRKNITEKLGIKSISGLTVYAILNKLIDTDSINPEDLI